MTKENQREVQHNCQCMRVDGDLKLARTMNVHACQHRARTAPANPSFTLKTRIQSANNHVYARGREEPPTLLCTNIFFERWHRFLEMCLTS